MKIDPANGLAGLPDRRQKPTRTEPGNDGEFARILREAGESPTAQPGSLAVGPPAAAVPVVADDDARRHLLGAMDTVLDAMDSYRRVLAAPQGNLRHAQRHLEQAEQAAVSVGRLAGLVPEQELAGLARQTQAMVTMEAIRFRRGDYL